MKIVLFNINRLSFEGGAEKYFTEVGEELAQEGHEVIFLGDCRPILKFYIWLSVFQFLNPIWKLPKLFTQLKDNLSLKKTSIKIITHIPLKLISLVPFSKEKRKIKNFLKDSDIILIKNEIIELIFFWLLKIKNKNKYIIIFSSINYPFPKSLREKIHNFVYLSKFYNFLVKKIGKIIVSNSEDKKYFIEKNILGNNNVFYIPYGLKTDYFAKPNEIKITSNFNILFVGRMEEQKGIIYLKQIIENVNKDKDVKKINFCLVGSGPLENICHLLAKKYSNVEYKGQLSPFEVRKCYLQSDLVLIPSKWETFSYVCLEAQACGCPVIAFNIPGPLDIIEKWSGGLVPLGDIDLFRQYILKYIKIKSISAEKYTKHRWKIVKNSQEKFSIMNTVKDLKRLIND